MHQDLSRAMPVAARLCRSLSLLEARARSLSSGMLALEVERIRGEAGAHGLAAAERVAGAFAAAIAANGRAALLGCWFQSLADAIGCAAADPEQVADACLAAVHVRLH